MIFVTQLCVAALNINVGTDIFSNQRRDVTTGCILHTNAAVSFIWYRSIARRKSNRMS